MNRLLKWLLIGPVVLVVLAAGWFVADTPLDDTTRDWLSSPGAHDRTGLPEASRLRDLEAAQERFHGSELQRRCNRFDATCIRFAAGNPDAASASSERLEPAYWAIMESERLRFRDDAIGPGLEQTMLRLQRTASWLSALATAQRLVFLDEIVELGRIRPVTLTRSMARIRHHLARAPSMVEKMYYGGMLTTAIETSNAALATADPHGIRTIASQLDWLTRAERSLENAFRGELQFADRSLDATNPGFWSRLILKRNHLLGMMREQYASVAASTEADWQTYWVAEPEQWQTTCWERLFDPVGSTLVLVTAPAFASYPDALRDVDGNLAVSRALADAYLNGRADPSQGAPAVPWWSFVWHADEARLCLEPDEPVRAARNDAAPYCAAYLSQLRTGES